MTFQPIPWRVGESRDLITVDVEPHPLTDDEKHRRIEAYFAEVRIAGVPVYGLRSIFSQDAPPGLGAERAAAEAKSGFAIALARVLNYDPVKARS